MLCQLSQPGTTPVRGYYKNAPINIPACVSRCTRTWISLGSIAKKNFWVIEYACALVNTKLSQKLYQFTFL